VVHIDQVLLERICAHENRITFHRNFGKTSVFEGQHCCQKERVNQVPIVVEQLQVDSQTPNQLPLDNAQALFVRRTRLLDHFLDEVLQLNAHFRERVRLLIKLS